MTPPKKKHTLSALVENKFGVLARVAGMLSGRGFNIETLNVGPTHDPAYSRITATVVADDAALDRCVKALDKLINVITVNDFSREEVDHVARELIRGGVGTRELARAWRSVFETMEGEPIFEVRP